MVMGVRQQPGLACEECRRRKARCDRTRPQCAACAESGTMCVVVEKRPPRGPKKGQLKALRNRIATLERQLHHQKGSIESELEVDPEVIPTSVQEPSAQILFPGTDISLIDTASFDPYSNTTPFETTSDDLADITSLTPTSLYSDFTVATDYSFNDGMVPLSPDTSPERTLHSFNSTPLLGDFDISELNRANLDQLYFDRVHAFAPIIHKGRYFSWSGQEHVDPARKCLRSAMQTMAASVTSPFRHLSHSLYAQTRQMLDALDPVTGQLEQIQACLLLAHYEYLNIHENRAMLTAGHAFRLVQMSRLYDVDNLSLSPTTPTMIEETFAEVEERRRTFWLAFVFDRFLSTRNEWPLTLHEETICTRLPAPETNFQNSQPIAMAFLPEAIADSGRSTLSSFAECIVLATLYGRCVMQRRMVHPTIMSSVNSHSIWTQVKWLAVTLEKRTQRLVETSSLSLSFVEHDSMLAFAHMLGHSAIIHLYNTTQTTPFLSMFMTLEYEHRAYMAAAHTARLAKAISQLCQSQVHPFSPNPLFSAASFLITRVRIPDLHTGMENDGSELEQLLGALRRLRDVNILANDLLDILEGGMGQALVHEANFATATK